MNQHIAIAKWVFESTKSDLRITIKIYFHINPTTIGLYRGIFYEIPFLYKIPKKNLCSKQVLNLLYVWIFICLVRQGPTFPYSILLHWNLEERMSICPVHISLDFPSSIDCKWEYWCTRWDEVRGHIRDIQRTETYKGQVGDEGIVAHWQSCRSTSSN